MVTILKGDSKVSLCNLASKSNLIINHTQNDVVIFYPSTINSECKKLVLFGYECRRNHSLEEGG